jgi:hypothetical protein
VQTGSRGQYQWLTSDEHDLASLLATCPQAVLDKYVAVTSYDSGSLTLNDEEVAAGWESRKGIAYSPKIESVVKLRPDGFDEWYVFDSPTDLGQLFKGNVFEKPLRAGIVAAFVNFGGFSLSNPVVQGLLDLFWPQLESIGPESLIADGAFLNFVSRDKALFAAVCTALK